MEQVRVEAARVYPGALLPVVGGGKAGWGKSKNVCNFLPKENLEN